MGEIFLAFTCVILVLVVIYIHKNEKEKYFTSLISELLSEETNSTIITVESVESAITGFIPIETLLTLLKPRFGKLIVNQKNLQDGFGEKKNLSPLAKNCCLKERIYIETTIS